MKALQKLRMRTACRILWATIAIGLGAANVRADEWQSPSGEWYEVCVLAPYEVNGNDPSTFDFDGFNQWLFMSGVAVPTETITSIADWANSEGGSNGGDNGSVGQEGNTCVASSVRNILEIVSKISLPAAVMNRMICEKLHLPAYPSDGLSRAQIVNGVIPVLNDCGLKAEMKTFTSSTLLETVKSTQAVMLMLWNSSENTSHVLAANWDATNQQLKLYITNSPGQSYYLAPSDVSTFCANSAYYCDGFAFTGELLSVTK